MSEKSGKAMWAHGSCLREAVPALQKAPRGSCAHCGHPIGYHHLDGEKCSVKDCRCPGYEARKKINGFQQNEIQSESPAKRK